MQNKKPDNSNKKKSCLSCFYNNKGFCKNLCIQITKDSKVCKDYFEHPDHAYEMLRKKKT